MQNELTNNYDLDQCMDSSKIIDELELPSDKEYICTVLEKGIEIDIPDNVIKNIVK